jgi:hypothetical protein
MKIVDTIVRVCSKNNQEGGQDIAVRSNELYDSVQGTVFDKIL